MSKIANYATDKNQIHWMFLKIQCSSFLTNLNYEHETALFVDSDLY